MQGMQTDGFVIQLLKKKKASRGSLHKAAISGQYETVKMLLESGEDVDQRDQVLFQSFFLNPVKELKRVIWT